MAEGPRGDPGMSKNFCFLQLCGWKLLIPLIQCRLTIFTCAIWEEPGIEEAASTATLPSLWLMNKPGALLLLEMTETALEKQRSTQKTSVVTSSKIVPSKTKHQKANMATISNVGFHTHLAADGLRGWMWGWRDEGDAEWLGYQIWIWCIFKQTIEISPVPTHLPDDPFAV